MSLVELLIRFAVTILVLLLMARLDGPRQIAQMNFYDYVVGIAVGSVAASACLDANVPLWMGVVTIVLFLLAAICMSWLARKNMTLRRFLSGKPIVLIAGGKLQWAALGRAKMNINELLSKLRHSGYFDIGQVQYAVMEPTGDLSVQPKGFARPPMACEMNVQAADASLLANVIVDGSILTGNLTAYGKDEAWLLGQLKAQGVRLDGTALATLDAAGQLAVYPKEGGPSSRTSFI